MVIIFTRRATGRFPPAVGTRDTSQRNYKQSRLSKCTSSAGANKIVELKYSANVRVCDALQVDESVQETGCKPRLQHTVKFTGLGKRVLLAMSRCVRSRPAAVSFDRNRIKDGSYLSAKKDRSRDRCGPHPRTPWSFPSGRRGRIFSVGSNAVGFWHPACRSTYRV